jgi:hypothetical protein
MVNDAAGTQDAYGHGTNVAGIVGGNGSSSTGPQYTKTFKGIAPNTYTSARGTQLLSTGASQ